MYVPNQFKVEDYEKLQQHIRDYSFGLLVNTDDEGIEANHVPFRLSLGTKGSLEVTVDMLLELYCWSRLP